MNWRSSTVSGSTLKHAWGQSLAAHDLSIDLDYDRHGLGPKRLPPRSDRRGEARFRPDLVLHRRREDSKNLLVVEWKKQGGMLLLACLAERMRRLLEVGDGGSGYYGYQLGIVVDSSASAIRWRTHDRGDVIGDWRIVRASSRSR